MSFLLSAAKGLFQNPFVRKTVSYLGKSLITAGKVALANLVNKGVKFGIKKVNEYVGKRVNPYLDYNDVISKKRNGKKINRDESEDRDLANSREPPNFSLSTSQISPIRPRKRFGFSGENPTSFINSPF